MKEEGLLDALAALCEGKAPEQKVQVDADILVNAHNELKEKVQMRKELEMARDEAQGMKPSVARKLNEKIRALEAELDTLRTNKKVSDLEKKVKFLEQELKQSYTTKNFTLKSGLLELEKQYRAHMNVDPAMAAFWADVTVLLDEKKDKDSQPQFKGPPSLSDSSTPRVSTSSQQQDGTAAAKRDQQAPGAAADSCSSQTGAADASVPSSTSATATAAAAACKEPQQLQSHPASFGVQMQVDAFNSIISEEAAGAAALPTSSDGSSAADQVPRQAGAFRIVRAQQQPTAAAADGSVVQESLQPVRVLKDSYSNMCKDVVFRPLPATLNSHIAGTVAAASSGCQQPQIADAQALEVCREHIRSSVAELQQVSDRLQADSSSDSSPLQQHVEQLVSSAQQLTAAADTQQPRQQEVEQLLKSVQQLIAAWEHPGSSSSAEVAEEVQKQLLMVQRQVQRLQQLQQQSAHEAEIQQLLVQVFGDFFSQLGQQGIIAGSQDPAATSAAAGEQENQQQQHLLLHLLQKFLKVNPLVPHLLASRLPPTAAAAAPAKQGDSTSSAVGVQQSHDTNHVSIQAAVPLDTTHAETQSDPVPSPTVHASTQSGVVDATHAATQYDNSHMPALHVNTQAAAEQATASTQAEGVQSSHVETQSDPLPSPSAHVSIQATSEQASIATQASPPGSPVHAEVQAELKPEAAEAALQVDLITAADAGSAAPAAAVDTSPSAVAVDGDPAVTPAGLTLPPARQTSALSQDQQQAGSGVIYSASGSELTVGKVAVGQQLDVLHQLQQQRSNGTAQAAGISEDGDSSHQVSAVIQVKAEELNDVQAVAKELSQLRADNMVLAASLQVTKSLVDHLNSSMKSAIDKADDAEAEAAHIRVQLESATASLQQLQSEHADLTKLLIEAKVEIAEKKGELLELVRNLRRAVEKPTSAAGMVKELQEILAVLPGAEAGPGELEGRSSIDIQTRPAVLVNSAGGLAGFAAGLGQAFGAGSISRRSRAPSDSGGSADNAGGSGGGRRASEQ